MAVQLFKNGSFQVFDEYNFTDRLADGWFLSEAESLKAVVPKEDAVGRTIYHDEPKEEAMSNTVDYDAMTKKELELYARGFNDKDGKFIELDRRMNKNNMLKDFNERKG